MVFLPENGTKVNKDAEAPSWDVNFYSLIDDAYNRSEGYIIVLNRPVLWYFYSYRVSEEELRCL